MMNIFAAITITNLVVIFGILCTFSQAGQPPSSCTGKCQHRDEICMLDLPGSAQGTPSCVKVCTRVKVVCIPECTANTTCTVVGPDGCQNHHATHAICLPQKSF